jgi:hypothetical protein
LITPLITASASSTTFGGAKRHRALSRQSGALLEATSRRS